MLPRLVRLVLPVALACGCGRGRGADDAVARAGAELRAADELGASQRVAELARGGCDDLSRALAAVAASQISGPRLGALARDAVRAAASACPPDRAVVAARGETPAHAVARSLLLESLGRPADALAALEAA
ncbi:MAG TPA: hypothetical protein VMZ28_27975, partial [Kofleriaceae bacterium]|nr:hypothetical protein [Kofleriaceae bacterium]